MRLSTKHGNQQALSLMDYTGGLNLSKPAELLEQNECAQLDNFEFNSVSGALATVPGLELVIDCGVTIDWIFYDCLHGVNLIKSGQKLYYSNPLLGGLTLAGTLTGTKVPMFDYFCDKTYVVSGGQLQYFDGGSLITVDSSPANSDIVFVVDIAERLAILNTNDAQCRIKLSKIGDASSSAAWTDITNDDSGSKYIDINPNDGYKITSIGRINKDIIIFKAMDGRQKGSAYRLTGVYPSWSCVPFSHNIHCANRFSAVEAVNDLFFMGRAGFNNLQTVVEYGDVKENSAGQKINNTLIGDIDISNCAMWHIPSKQQIWIKSSRNNFVWLYHYTVNGAFTVRKFASGAFSSVTENGNDVYVSIGTKILRLNSSVITDDGTAIKCAFKSKKFVSDNYFLIKRIDLDIFSSIAGSGTADIMTASFPVVFTSSGIDIYGDDVDIYGDNEDIYESSYTNLTYRMNYRLKSFDVTLQFSNAPIGLRSIILQVVEV